MRNVYSDFVTGKKPYFGVLLVLIFSAISIFVLPRVFLKGLDSLNKANEVGDAINGIAAPFLTVGAAVLTFYAFWVQFRANQEQRKYIYIERFQTRLMALIDIHRSNVFEIRDNMKPVDSVEKNVDAFERMVTDLKATYNWLKDKGVADIFLMDITALVFYYGARKNDDIISDILQGTPLESTYQKVKPDLLAASPLKETNGYFWTLSCYIPHLFDTLRFINSQHFDKAQYDATEPRSLIGKKYAEDAITQLSYAECYEYAALVRSQLSAHEQILLYLLTLSTPHNPWVDVHFGNYLEKYCLVKRIPWTEVSFAMAPDKRYPPNSHGKIVNKVGKEMFERSEFHNRIVTRYSKITSTT